MKALISLSMIAGAVTIAVLAPNTTDYHFLAFMMIAGAIIIINLD